MRKPQRKSLGIVALGVGFGAALAAMPAVASADSVGGADIAAYIPDFGALAAASSAAVTPPTLPADYSNYAISVYGIPLYQSGTAFATSSFGNYAIAHGDHAGAFAPTGLFNHAVVDGNNSVAGVNGNGFGFFNSATVTGSNSSALATMGTGGASYNVATTTGDGSLAYAGHYDPNGISGSFNTATAEGYLALAYADTNGTSNNVANAIGDRSYAYSPVPLGAAAEPSGAATATDLLADPAAAAAAVTPPVLPDDYSNYAVSVYGVSLIKLGTADAQTTFGNIAIAHGDHAAANAYSSGFFNFASANGDNSLASDGVNSGWFNTATAEGQYAMAGTGGALGYGSFNTATATGWAAGAFAGYQAATGGADSYNTATAEGTGALANAGGDGTSNNVANAIGDNVIVFVHGGPGASAATDSSLTDLLSSLGGGSAAADSGNWFTDLLSSFDAGSAAGDSANFWTELTTLF